MKFYVTVTKLLVLAALLSLLGCAPQSSQTEAERLSERAENVTIIRDDYGVPHIYAKTDADAVFGLLYAQAEDDFNRIERNYVWATGRLAEVEGESALYSDLRARLYMTTAEAKAAYDDAPDWIKDLCDAYADGLNYYLASNPDVKPKLLTRFEPWMPMFFSEGSIGGDIEQIPLSGIRAFYADGTPRQAPETMPRTMDEPGGSNGFAISGDLTTSGNAMLLINPHTSFYFRGEVHVVSEEGLNAYGAVTWGQFFVYQGFSEHNGWMHTSTYLDFMDEFIEDVYEQDGTLFYRYGNESRPVEVSDVTLSYKDGNEMKARTFPTYRTHHGPITHMQDDGKWVATKINWDPVNALKQSFLRTKTKNHDEFRDMMDIRTNSSNNTVYADSSGNIAYYHGNFVPKRDTQFDYSKPVDGSNPATDWQGIHTVDESISLLNPENGWLQNCNSTPFTAALEYSPKPEDYPVYMAPDPENFRGINAVRVLKEQKDFTLDKLIETAYDPYLPAFEILIPSLVRAYDAQANETQTSPAIETLRNWDYTVSTDSSAMSLAHFYGTKLFKTAPHPKGLNTIEKVNYFSTEFPEAERLKIFETVLDDMNADFGTWDTPWGAISRFQRLSGDINLTFDDSAPSLPAGFASSRWGALAAYGQRGKVTTKKIYGTRGNSFVAVVEFGDKVSAKTLLAGGQSGDPSSPHFYDQAQNYVDNKFKDIAYYKDDVLARAQHTYHPGQ